MALKWAWHGVSMVVEDQTRSREVKRGELFVLESSESTLHFFGSGSEKRQIKGIIIDDLNADKILNYASTDSAGTLVTDQGSAGSWKINGTPKLERIKYSGGVIDGTAYVTDVTPLYRLDMELIKVG